VVEGCKDPLARNFNALANEDSNTWCIPFKPGCMMPLASSSGPGYDPGTERLHTRDGTSTNFDPAATVNSVDTCIIARYGCKDPDATNYDPEATIDAPCVTRVKGCLNKKALNFNCLERQNTPCLDREPKVNDHRASRCLYEDFLPPSPPPPPGFPGVNQITLQTVSGSLSFAGSATNCKDKEKLVLETAEAVTDNLAEPVIVWSECRTGTNGIVIDYRLGYPTTADRDAFVEKLTEKLNTAEGRAAVAETTGLLPGSFYVVSSGEVTIIESAAAPPPPPPGLSTGAIVGIVLGSIGGAALTIGVTYFCVKSCKAGAKTVPAY